MTKTQVCIKFDSFGKGLGLTHLNKMKWANLDKIVKGW